MMKEIKYDSNIDYFYLYQQTLEENQKLRERIDYPKLEIKEQNTCFGKKEIWIDMLMGDGFTKLRQFKEYDALLDNQKDFKKNLINFMLDQMGHIYFERAYRYWKAKEGME